MITLSIVGFYYGNFKKLVAPIDGDGKMCGFD
jgi:hypothetical protein